MSTAVRVAFDEIIRRNRMTPAESAREAMQTAIRRADAERRPYNVYQSTRTGRFFAWPAAGCKPPHARYLCPVNPTPIREEP